MPDNTWSTAVGEVGEGKITVRGVPLVEIIRTCTFAETVYLTIRGSLPTPAQARVVDAALCSIVEHAFYSPTTVAARVVTSATPDTIMPGIAAGLLTVGGVTVSPQHTAELIGRVRALEASGKSLDEAADEVCAELLATKRRMPGIGHPLHPEGDPRALMLEEVAREAGTWGTAGQAFDAIRERYLRAIDKTLPTNIDGMLGCVLTDLGFKPAEMPGIAALSFMPGIIAHCVEEATEPPRLRIEWGSYTGSPDRSLDAARPNGNSGAA